MANMLQQNLEKANKVDNNTDLFSPDDLKAFTDLVKDKDNFNEMVKGFEDGATIDALKKIT